MSFSAIVCATALARVDDDCSLYVLSSRQKEKLPEVSAPNLLRKRVKETAQDLILSYDVARAGLCSETGSLRSPWAQQHEHFTRWLEII
jgi:hypothetical protein